MRRVWILAPTVLLLAACGGSSNNSASPTTTASSSSLQTISLSEKEFSITPKSISVAKTGTYTFDVKNDGSITHALEVEGNGIEQKTGDIQPGSSTTLTVTLSKHGSYEVYCPIDGHRQNGMEASLAVGGAAGGGMTTGETSSGSTTSKGGSGY